MSPTSAQPSPFYIVGPTGSGKSSLALRLAERWDGEIVNADAFQLYQGMPIITATPSAAERQRLPHHLYEVVPPDEECNVARYAVWAQQVIQEIQERHHRPIIVGGSGLYIKALTHGLADTPPADPDLRQGLSGLTNAHRIEWLQKLDPLGAAQINLKNPRYVERALEMTLLAGVPASELKAQWQRQNPPDIDGVVLRWERAELYARINQRVEDMLQKGALEEVAQLPANLSATAAKAIGVRELRAHLRGETPLADAMGAIQQATRRFAKRQETWFRRETVFRPIDHRSAFETLSRKT